MDVYRSKIRPLISVSGLVLAMLLGGAPQALAQYYSPAPVTAQQNRVLLSENFLGREFMQGPLHSVESTTHNDGQANHYRVNSRHGTHMITGTDQTKAFIREIYTADALRKKSTVGTIGSAAGNRVLNLVKAPVKLVGAVGDRLNTIGSVEDAILIAPRTALDVGEKLVTGAGEMVYTGGRLIKGVGGSGLRCDGLGNCLNEAGKDILSGLNSVAGKHGAARRLHAQYGTDSETRNPILKKEIDRLSYAQAYTNAGLRLFAPDTGITDLDDYRDAVGYYNSGQTVSKYRDARKPREEQKDRLAARGVPQSLIQAFYKNDNYTKRERLDLISNIETLGPHINLAPLVGDAAKASSPYAAKGYTAQYAYLAGLSQAYGLMDFTGTTSPIAITSNGQHILTRKADYLEWTPATAQDVAQLSRLRNPEFHVIGHASEEVKHRAQSQGVRVFVTG